MKKNRKIIGCWIIVPVLMLLAGAPTAGAEDVAVLTKEELKTLHTCIKKIYDDLERFSFNTCVSGFMIATNDLRRLNTNKRAILEPMTILLAPFAPHLAEELWHRLGGEGSIFEQSWPTHDPARLVLDEILVVVQINGKVRAKLSVAASASEEEVKDAAMADANVEAFDLEEIDAVFPAVNGVGEHLADNMAAIDAVP